MNTPKEDLVRTTEAHLALLNAAEPLTEKARIVHAMTRNMVEALHLLMREEPDSFLVKEPADPR